MLYYICRLFPCKQHPEKREHPHSVASSDKTTQFPQCLPVQINTFSAVTTTAANLFPGFKNVTCCLSNLGLMQMSGAHIKGEPGSSVVFRLAGVVQVKAAGCLKHHCLKHWWGWPYLTVSRLNQGPIKEVPVSARRRSLWDEPALS